MKRLCIAWIWLVAWGPAVTGACAQDKLPRTIKLVVPSAAGGVHDVIARLWADRLQADLGTIVIDNRGSSGGAIAVVEVARAQPDGGMLLLASNSTHVLRPLIWGASGKQLAFDPIKDFQMIVVFADNATALAVTAALPVRTLKELVALAKAGPGKLTYAHAGVGASSHVAAEMFKQLAGGLDILPVPYRGMGPAQTDVINGTISLFVPNITGQVVGLHTAGQIRLLAVNAAARHPSVPEIETAVEGGLPDMITQNFFAIFAPIGLPRAMIERVNVATRQAVAEKAYQERLAQAGFDVIVDMDVERSAQFLKDELARWDRVIKTAGIKG